MVRASPRRNRRRWAGGGGVVLALGALLWTARAVGEDPLDLALRRRGRLAGVVEGPAFERGSRLVRELRLVSTSGLEARVEIAIPTDADPPLPARLSCGEGPAPPGADSPRVEARLLAPRPESGAGPEEVCEVAAALVLAVDALAPLPEVDRAAIELAGLGAGVPPAALAAALDSRPTLLWLAPAPDAARPGLLSRLGLARARDPLAFLPRIAPRPVRVLGRGPLAEALRAALPGGP